MWRPHRNTYHDDRDWEDALAGGVRNIYEDDDRVEEVPYDEVAATAPGEGTSPTIAIPSPGRAAVVGRAILTPDPPAPRHTPSIFTPRTPGQIVSATWEAIRDGRLTLPSEMPAVPVSTPAPAPAAAPAPGTALVVPDDAVIEAVVVEPATRDSVDDPTAPLPIGQHTFEDLRGSAGTGKTYLTKQLARRAPKGSILLAATTGIAAVNLGGGEFETTTINAIGKYFDTEDLREKYLHGRLVSTLNRQRRAGVTRIVIDEKSMLAPEQLTYWTRAVMESNDPTQTALQEMSGEDVSMYKGLAPLALTLVGDFAQLAPVPDVDPNDPKKKKKLPMTYAFDSPEWPRYAAHTHALTKIWRQNDVPFIDALHAIRRGDAEGALRFFTPEKFSRTSDDTFVGTTIFATNAEVERYNGVRLDALQAPLVVSARDTWGELRSDWNNVPLTFHGKIGATVMLLSNEREAGYRDRNGHWRDGEIIYANGDLGEIVQVVPPVGSVDRQLSPKDINQLTSWLVRLHRNGEIVSVNRVRRKNFVPLDSGRLTALKAQYPNTWADYLAEDRKKEMIGWIDYLPLRVAYAATVNKTQGLTLDNVQVNIGDYFFRQPGRLFVSLSRARSPEGLRIVGDQASFAQRCVIDSRVLPWL